VKIGFYPLFTSREKVGHVSMWVTLAIGAGSVLLLVAAVTGGVLAWRAAERRYLLRLISRREAVLAVRQVLEGAVMRLAEGSDERLEMFSSDADSADRRVLCEVASRAQVLADELDVMALPKRLIPAARALSDAAYVVAREAGKVLHDEKGDRALEELGSIDLEAVSHVFEVATSAVSSACRSCGVDEDSTVYGGGLYL